MVQDDGMDEVVISGIGCRFPESENLFEFAQNLYSGKDLLTDDPRKLNKGFFEDIPERSGMLINGHLGFDFTFFGISKSVATAMDPMNCQLLERTFEALIDAGINPSDLKGTDTSVFTGSCHSDSDLDWGSTIKVGYGVMGRNRCMNSNRISYWLDLNGCSHSVDSGWTNGLTVLYHGWNSIRTGKSDTAIVGVCNLQKVVLPTIQLKDFGVLSPDGYTKSFDDSANGWGRCSAVIVFILQKASIAKRCYATIGHVFYEFVGSGDKALHQSSQKDWETLFTKFYEKSNIDVNDIYYLEAHGSGIKEEDAAELNAVTEFFCKSRKTPLYIGCVKSNMGHGESASSFCGLAKVIVSMENSMIPQNLHYKNPNSQCFGLMKGMLKVIDKNTPLPSNSWIAVNCHSFGGTYGHVVLKPNLKNKFLKYDGIPRLVLLADRTNDFMSESLEKVESTPFDLEYIALLHEIHSKKVDRYFGRGYTILPKPQNPIHENQVHNEDKRPIWFIFSGMGSQWPTMGKRLMDLPLFRHSIERSHEILVPKGLDLIKIITDDDPKMFDNILNSFVGIAAIQIALIDILNALKITPDGLIGHSVGELGCSYADGCFTAEQMILAAYYRGRASRESDLIQGSMAAIGKGYKDIKDKLPDDIEVACHNASDSCTISGPADSIKKFVEELKEKGVFAKAVNVSNIAYHSRYIKPAAPKLLKYLQEVIPHPKLRSSKWISTSNPEDKWDTELAKYCSAEYHTNNLLSSVLFEEGSRHIPKNAICIEIAPHGLLQSFLKRSLGEDTTNIPLTSRLGADPLIFLLQAIGKMYMAGIDISIMNLYPKIEFPVSRGTPSLNNLPHWHEQTVVLIEPETEAKVKYSFKSRLQNVAEEGTEYITSGRNKYPFSLFLCLLWELYASQNKAKTEECPVIFKNFKVERLVDVHLTEDDNINVYFLNGSGDFELVDRDRHFGAGTISLLKEKPLVPFTGMLTTPDLTGEEIYIELQRKGFTFGKYFKMLLAVYFKENAIFAEIPKTADWHQIIESIIQVYLLHAEDSGDFGYFPLTFGELEISSLMHLNLRNSLSNTSNIILVFDFITSTISCGGITFKRLKNCKLLKISSNLNFDSCDFFPFFNPALENIKRFSEFCLGLVLDNLSSTKKLCGINVLEVIVGQRSSSVGDYLRQLHVDVKVKVTVATLEDTYSKNKECTELVIATGAPIEVCSSFLIGGGFLLVKVVPNAQIPSHFTVVAQFCDNFNNEYLLLRKNLIHCKSLEFIHLNEDGNINLNNTLEKLKHSENILYVISHKKPTEGIENFKIEIQSKTDVPLRWIFILDPNAPPFNPEIPFYEEQLKKGLTTYVYSSGAWGFYSRFSFCDSLSQNEVNFNLEKSSVLEANYISITTNDDLIDMKQVEFSGKMSNKRIMGISKLENKRKIIVDKSLIWELPEYWSLEDGATAPVSYGLAYYCLVILGEQQKTDRVLITDAMTCIGQAHVSVALSLGSRVWVTVGDENEAIAIKKMFPQLRDSDVLNHNETKFDVKWKLSGNREYMNIVINQLEGEKFFSTLQFLGEFSKMYHFGKGDSKKNTKLGTYMFLVTTSVYAESPETLLRLPYDEKERLHELLQQGIQTRVVKPLHRIVMTIDEFQKFQSSAEEQNRIKLLLKLENFKPVSNFIKFDSQSSYLVIGDKTHLWVDIVEWLLNRRLTNIVVGRCDNTKRSQVRIPILKNRENVLVYDHQDVKKLLEKAQKLGPISAVYYLSMDLPNGNSIISNLDKLYRIKNSHLFTISKYQGILSEICNSRNALGFPTTNFIWNASEIKLRISLEYMSKLCGRNSVIMVTPPALLSSIDNKLGEFLPSTIDDFCYLGASLTKQIDIVPLHTLAGISLDKTEVPLLIIISDLQNDPVKFFQPIVSNFLYPTVCLKMPDKHLSIPQLVTLILPEIIKYNKTNCYNLIGISWSGHVAIELTRQLESLGANVGLVLIEGPIHNGKSLLTKTLEWDILNLIQGKYRNAADIQVLNDEGSWREQLIAVIGKLKLSLVKEKHFYRAATFIYNKLQALLDYDISRFNLNGPLTVICSHQRQLDDKILSKLCQNISIRRLPYITEQLMASEEVWNILHGSAIAPTMCKSTIQKCSWPCLEEVLHRQENEIY